MAEEVIEILQLETSVVPNDCIRRLEEQTVKGGGEIWRIHKNDADPFPSNPHAHNVEKGLKLDLSNGSLFLQRRPTGKTISKKHLLTIRGLMTKITPPPLAV